MLPRSGWSIAYLGLVLRMVSVLFLVSWCIPGVRAHDDNLPFPDIPFQHFADFVADYFARDVSLSVVLAFLFTILRNPSILSLHYQRKFDFFDKDVVDHKSNWGTFMVAIMHTARTFHCKFQ